MSLPNHEFVNNLVIAGFEDAYGWLQDFANSEDFIVKSQQAFGDRFDPGKLETLQQQWVTESFEALPQFEIRLSEELQGANAAYAGENNTIYFSENVLLNDNGYT
jgi:hypothetical protein